MKKGRAIFDWMLELAWLNMTPEQEHMLGEWHRSFAWLPVRIGYQWHWLVDMERRGFWHLHEYGQFGFEYRAYRSADLTA